MSVMASVNWRWLVAAIEVQPLASVSPKTSAAATCGATCSASGVVLHAPRRGHETADHLTAPATAPARG